MAPRTGPTPSRDGRHRLTIRVEHRLTRDELVSAVMICAELSADSVAYAERPVADIRSDVVDLLRESGSSMGALDGMGVESVGEAYARAEAIVAKVWPPFPLDPPREPSPGRTLLLRPRGRGGVDLVDDDGATFEWPARSTTDETPTTL